MVEKLQPLGDRVIVKPMKKETMTKSGLIIPDTAKEKPQEGEVIAVGPGRKNDDGIRTKMNVKIGDVVLYAMYGGTEVKLNGEDVLIMSEHDVLAIQQADKAAAKTVAKRAAKPAAKPVVKAAVKAPVKVAAKIPAKAPAKTSSVKKSTKGK